MEATFTIQASSYLAAARIASSAIIPKPVVPSLANIRFEVTADEVMLTGSDSETTVTAHAQLRNGSSTASFLVPSQFAIEPFKGLSLQILTFEYRGDRLDVSWDGGLVSLPTFSSEEYPALPQPSGDTESGSVDAKSLKDALELTDYACAKDEARPILMGVNFEFRGTGLDLVATDAHRLVATTIPEASSLRAFSFPLPKKTVAVLKPLLRPSCSVAVTRCGNYATFAVGETLTVVGRLLEGSFPAWRAVVPTSLPFTAKVDRDALVAACGRIDACAGGEGVLKMDFRPSMLGVYGQNIGFGVSGNEDVRCEYDGDGVTVGMRSALAVPLLSKLPGVRVCIDVRDPKTNIIFRDDDYNEEKMHTMALLTPMIL